MLSQPRAKDRLHQQCSSAVKSRALMSTASVARGHSGRRLTYQAGMGVARTGFYVRGMADFERASPSKAGNCFGRACVGPPARKNSPAGYQAKPGR